MRLWYLNVLYVLSQIVETIRTRNNFWKDLGNLWYIRGAYVPTSVALGGELEFHSRDYFELVVDFGPFSVALGRDFVS